MDGLARELVGGFGDMACSLVGFRGDAADDVDMPGGEDGLVGGAPVLVLLSRARPVAPARGLVAPRARPTRSSIPPPLVPPLTDRARHNRIHVVTGVVEGETPSTKAARTLFGKISERKNLLLVVDRADEAAWLSARNLPQVHILEPGQLNTYDVIVSDDVVFTQAALESFVAGPKANDTEGTEV